MCLGMSGLEEDCDPCAYEVIPHMMDDEFEAFHDERH